MQQALKALAEVESNLKSIGVQSEHLAQLRAELTATQSTGPTEIRTSGKDAVVENEKEGSIEVMRAKIIDVHKRAVAAMQPLLQQERKDYAGISRGMNELLAKELPVVGKMAEGSLLIVGPVDERYFIVPSSANWDVHDPRFQKFIAASKQDWQNLIQPAVTLKPSLPEGYFDGPGLKQKIEGLYSHNIERGLVD